MKYLRRIFEEVNRDEYVELKDFCEMYLAYLIDEGWMIDIEMRTAVYPNKGHYDVLIWKNYVVAADDLIWDDISDQFIPFFKVLIDNYELIPSVSRSMKTEELVDNLVEFSGANVPKEKILNDLIPGNQPVRKIKFKVKRKI